MCRSGCKLKDAAGGVGENLLGHRFLKGSVPTTETAGERQTARSILAARMVQGGGLGEQAGAVAGVRGLGVLGRL